MLTRATLLLAAVIVDAESVRCTLLVDADSGDVLSREGTLCDERTSPASTFKAGLLHLEVLNHKSRRHETSKDL